MAYFKNQLRSYRPKSTYPITNHLYHQFLHIASLNSTALVTWCYWGLEPHALVSFPTFPLELHTFRVTHIHPPPFCCLCPRFFLFFAHRRTGTLVVSAAMRSPTGMLLVSYRTRIWTRWWLNDQLQDIRLSTPFTCLYAHWQMVERISQSAGRTPAPPWLLRHS